MPLQRRGGIAIERRADVAGKLREAHVLSVENAVLVVEVMHEGF
jgi:hypothetical protein